MGQAITGVFTMIDQILSNTLAEKIVKTVRRQCCIFQKDEQMIRRNLYGPYTQRRQKYNLTAYVLSGFAPGRFIMNGVTVQDIQYSLPTAPLFQPELHTDTAIIQIYSNGAKLQDNKVVQERCKEHNGTQQNGPHFLLIRFSADKDGQLKRIEALYLNEDCVTMETKLLYQSFGAAMLTFAG